MTAAWDREKRRNNIRLEIIKNEDERRCEDKGKG